MSATEHVSDFSPDFAAPSEWAAMYRAVGIQVVPAHMPNGGEWKFPLGKWKTFQDELVPRSTFDNWYGQGGEHARRQNMGLITGKASGGVFVIDLDEYKTPMAAQWWRGVLMEHNHGLEPETWQQRTGGGGRQLFFQAPAHWRPPTNKTPIGVDIRGQGGFAMLPPSKHSSDKTYEWVPGFAPWEIEIEVAPDWLMLAVDDLVAQHGGDTARGEKSERTASPEGRLRRLWCQD